MPTDTPGRKAGLSREVLVRAALGVVDRDGLDALSMRRLGSELGVDPMAAYRHFPNKESLLDGVVEAVVSEIDLATDPATPWSDQVRRLAGAYRAALLRHPAVAPLVASRPASTPGALRLAERSLALMEDAGVPRHEAILAVNALGVLVSGMALLESASAHPTEDARRQLGALASLPPDEFPRMLDLVTSGDIVTSYEEMTDFGVGAIVGSLHTRPAESVPR